MASLRSDPDKYVQPILKWVLSIFNFFAFLIGFGFVCGGAYLLYTRDSIAEFEDAKALLGDLGTYCIIVGILINLLTIFAAASTIRENLFFLRLYLYSLCVIMVTNLVCGIVFLIFSGKITTRITEKLADNYIVNYIGDNNIKSIFDTLQSEYSCCGIDSYKDWNFNPYFNCNEARSSLACFVPSSCCLGYTSASNTFCSGEVFNSVAQVASKTIHTEGCAKAIDRVSQLGILILSGILIGVNLILIINIVLVQYLITSIRSEQALYNAKKSYVELDESDSERLPTHQQQKAYQDNEDYIEY
jgi:hypothetical protein